MLCQAWTITAKMGSASTEKGRNYGATDRKGTYSWEIPTAAVKKGIESPKKAWMVRDTQNTGSTLFH